METKTCNKCGLDKILSEFYFRKDSGKHRNSCIECEKNRLKQYYLENSETRIEYGKNYHKNNKEICNKRISKYRKTESGREKKNELNKLYRIRNQENELFRLTQNMRSLISHYIKSKGFRKSSKTAQLLGCSFEEFKIHIESQFEPWMNWSNHGLYSETEKRWQLDHIIPASSAKDEAELIRLNHYTNFQPLCAKENNWKSNKIMTQGQGRIISE